MLIFFEPDHFAIADKLQAEYKICMDKYNAEWQLYSDCETRKARQQFLSDDPHYEVEKDMIYKSEDAVRAYGDLNSQLAQRKLIDDIKNLRVFYKSTAILIAHSRLHRKSLPKFHRPSFASMQSLSSTAFTRNPINGYITCNANAHEILNLIAYKEDYDGRLFPSIDVQESWLGIHSFYDNWLPLNRKLIQIEKNEDLIGRHLFLAKYPEIDIFSGIIA